MRLRVSFHSNTKPQTFYESIYPLKKYNSPKVHKLFLNELNALLPVHCVPIIVTDAGSLGPWFRVVEKLGWFWLGRVRNFINYRLHSSKTWRRCTNLNYRANKHMKYLELADLSSKRPYSCHLYLYKKPKQHRKVKRSVMQYARHNNSDCFKKQQSEPWLIATNLSPEDYSPKKIMRLYGKRMQIEEAFRDLKSDKFGLTVSRSNNIRRLNILLMIAALATLCLWWIGLYAEQQGWHRHFQANTVKTSRVLSIPFVGQAREFRNATDL